MLIRKLCNNIITETSSGLSWRCQFIISICGSIKAGLGYSPVTIPMNNSIVH